MRTRRRFLKESAVLVAAAPFVDRAVAAGQNPSEFDYVIVGTSPSGCVLADRLSARAGTRVLIVEAGGPDTNPLVRVPGRWTSLLGTDLDWQYVTEPGPAVDERRVDWPRGRAYGGSTAIHAMAWVRGHRACFDGWAAGADAAWRFDALLPYFRRIEDNSRGASDYLGAGGPLAVADTTDPHDGHLAFLEAARQRGFAASPTFDFNGATQENGAGFYQKNIRDGRRHSAADAYLRPALDRASLTAWPDTLVRRVTFQGARATGIECARGNEVVTVRATRGVILAAGSIETPKLLMLSGVGPADALRRLGIAVVADRPAVGENLHDHPRVSIRWTGRRVLPPSSVSAGLLTFSARPPDRVIPDIQFYVGRGIDSPDDAITLTVALSRVRSRGSVTLRSADPVDPPAIQPNYYADPVDLEAHVDGLELARELAMSRAYDALRGDPLAPAVASPSRADLAAFARATSATMFHPVGTCRMGRDADAVVDSRLCVNGTDRLWVADASVMPTVVNSQTQAAAFVIGLLGSEWI
ncbi:MAG TPA: GMC family oxidoreductase N-terminal domain-containing protein [Vicinamibacterales bacterium]|nr:GMC family oxidoreductase N-terminal domain-containing protein [Vicinamibacterales bacterium]